MASVLVHKAFDGEFCNVLGFHQGIMLISSTLDFAAAAFHPRRVYVNCFVFIVGVKNIYIHLLITSISISLPGWGGILILTKVRLCSGIHVFTFRRIGGKLFVSLRGESGFFLNRFNLNNGGFFLD